MTRADTVYSNAAREEKESKIALIFIITSTLKIECGFKLIVLKIRGEFQNRCFEVAVAFITNLNGSCYKPLQRPE